MVRADHIMYSAHLCSSGGHPHTGLYKSQNRERYDEDEIYRDSSRIQWNSEQPESELQSCDWWERRTTGKLQLYESEEHGVRDQAEES